MPDFWSHQLAANAAHEKFLQSNPKHLKWSTDSQALYNFGAQGPDFFYYINKFNLFTKHRFKHIGNLVHEDHIQCLFKEMIDTILMDPSEENMAYVSGFLSHYLLDVYCHPIICKLGPDSDSHKRVELDLEAFCIHDYWKLDFKTFDVNALKTSPSSLEKGCAFVWKNALHSCYGESIDMKYIYQGHIDLLRVQKMLVNGTISKLPFPSLLSKMFHYDLTMLQFPDVTDYSLKSKRLYSEFEAKYVEGIEAIVSALIDLDRVVGKTLTVEEFVKTTILYDFLGEVTSNVYKSTR